MTTTSVKARLLAARKQPAEAVALVRRYVEAKPVWLGAGASLLDDLDQVGPAEELYRKFVAQAKQPETAFVLVRFLAHRQKLPEALDLCEQLWDKVPVEALAGVSMGALRAGKPGEEHFRRVESWLQRAIAKDPSSVVLLTTLSDLQELRGQYAEAERTYRQILQKQDRHIVALNNLAWILALKDGNGAEARLLIEKGLKITGPVPELLDTRGMVCLVQGQSDLAVKDLEAVVAQAPTASRYFHLALAHEQGRNRTAAAEALKKARSLNLDPTTLHPLERERYNKLVEQLQ